MFGYMTFNVKYYILSQIFYKKNRVNVYLEKLLLHCTSDEQALTLQFKSPL